MRANRFALCAFAAPFTVALAAPLFAALASVRPRRGVALWRVLEPDDENDGDPKDDARSVVAIGARAVYVIEGRKVDHTRAPVLALRTRTITR